MKKIMQKDDIQSNVKVQRHCHVISILLFVNPVGVHEIIEKNEFLGSGGGDHHHQKTKELKLI